MTETAAAAPLIAPRHMSVPVSRFCALSGTQIRASRFDAFSCRPFCRRLGSARLKGLGEVPVLELADAGDWRQARCEAMAPDRLLALADEIAAIARATGRQE